MVVAGAPVLTAAGLGGRAGGGCERLWVAVHPDSITDTWQMLRRAETVRHSHDNGAGHFNDVGTIDDATKERLEPGAIPIHPPLDATTTASCSSRTTSRGCSRT